MSHNKGGSLQSPFTNPHGTTLSGDTTEHGAVIDKNACPIFAHAREAGHSGVDEVFFAGVEGKNFHGSIEKDAANLTSPMRGDKK